MNSFNSNNSINIYSLEIKIMNVRDSTIQLIFPETNYGKTNSNLFHIENSSLAINGKFILNKVNPSCTSARSFVRNAEQLDLFFFS